MLPFPAAGTPLEHQLKAVVFLGDPVFSFIREGAEPADKWPFLSLEVTRPPSFNLPMATRWPPSTATSSLPTRAAYFRLDLLEIRLRQSPLAIPPLSRVPLMDCHLDLMKAVSIPPELERPV